MDARTRLDKVDGFAVSLHQTAGGDTVETIGDNE